MISFASTLLIAAADTAPPPPVAAQIAALVASAWHLPVERVRLAFGQLPPAAIPESAQVRLVGRGADGWFVAVTTGEKPVAVRVRAGVDDSVMVAAAPLAPGHHLAPSDIRRELRVRWGPPVSGAPVVSVGWQVRRALAAGEALLPPMVAPPTLVHAGAPVRFVWRHGTVEVEVSATALHDAALGSVVRAL
ncbi:MAG: flagellar basal body P-ring formation protein FlgA, partial [Gemmatimonadales bacterium]|nr:flagellar basal body P-ring formation protein FlgA [Gemmatimonadales bacterium]